MAVVPVEPLPASTVILLRDGSVSPETLLIERHGKSEFLPDMYVFPGGVVEEADHALAHRVTGVTVESAAEALGEVAPDLALGFFVAAIRETFEEAGILLARERGSPKLLDPSRSDELARHRLDVQAGHQSFRELVERENIDLAADQLAVHAHWITPERVPRRFDTFFFSALAPPGQLAQHDGIETTDHLWIRPEDALSETRAGKRRMIFPTAANLETLSGFRAAQEALEASRRRPVVAVTPSITLRDGVRTLVIRSDAGYPTTEEAIRAG